MARNRTRIKVQAIQGPKNQNEAPLLKELTLRYYAALKFFPPTPGEYREFYSLPQSGHLAISEADITLIENVDKFVLQQVVYGNEDVVLEHISSDPTIVEQKETVLDYSGRKINDATPFQAALRAGDEVMTEKIKEIYLTSAANDDIRQKRQVELDNQFHDVFPHGFEPHLKEQKSSAEQFERECLILLGNALNEASIADVQAVLRKQENDSALCQQLKKFKEEFTKLSLREKVYNPNHLLKVFEIYRDKHDEWYMKFHNYQLLELFWCHVIGWEERYMPTNYAQAFCTGLANIVEKHQPLKRTLKVYNHVTQRDIDFFPLDADANSLLGTDFGVHSYCWRGAAGLGGCGVVWAGGPKAGLLILQNLCLAKTAGLRSLCSASRTTTVNYANKS